MELYYYVHIRNYYTHVVVPIDKGFAIWGWKFRTAASLSKSQSQNCNCSGMHVASIGSSNETF